MKLLEIAVKTVNANKGYVSDKHGKFLDKELNYELFGDSDHYTSKISGTHELGRGAESIVFTKSKDSWISTVRKWVRNQPSDINNSLSIQYLLKGQDNPFCPQVYTIKQIQKSESSSDYLIDMEKLIPLDALNEQQLQMAACSVFSDHVQIESIRSFWLGLSICLKRNNTSMAVDKNVYQFKSQFIECSNLIKKVIQSSPQSFDLHQGNMMARITSVGVQLVITDPIYTRT